MDLSGKIAVVTGGSRGIGKAICLRLARLGVTVIVNYVSRLDAAEAVAQEVESVGGQSGVYQFNVADSEMVTAAFKAILADYGRIDILVNNAGITRDGLFMKMKEADWDDVLNINLKGAYNCIKAVTRPMMKQRSGTIISITSVVGFAGNSGQANYAAAKAGLVGLTRSLAKELSARNITVNGVAPGYIDTDMTKDLSDDVKDLILGEIPLKRMGNPEDIAGAVAFLVSKDARYITGQFIHVNGGMYMG